jgi:hypothetical protein
VLIGSNLEGLQGFIAEAWAELAPSLTLSPPDRPGAEPVQELEALAKRFRIVCREDQLANILTVMQSNGQTDAEALAAHEEFCRTQLAEYRSLKKPCGEGGLANHLGWMLAEQLNATESRSKL